MATFPGVRCNAAMDEVMHTWLDTPIGNDLLMAESTDAPANDSGS